MWLFSGILIGLGLAWYLAAKGYIPQPQTAPPSATDASDEGADESVLPDAPARDSKKSDKP
ncbi:MAG: hypothetical protein ACREO9_12570, partial [Lysobacterales bacterium]